MDANEILETYSDILKSMGIFEFEATLALALNELNSRTHIIWQQFFRYVLIYVI